ICIQECLPQARLAGLAYREVLPLVSRIPETCFPVPRLEIIGNPPHFATQANVEELIPVSELFMPGPGVLNATEADTGRDWEPTGGIIWSRRKEAWNRRVCNGERIERVGKWHTDALRTKEGVGARGFERIRCKRHRCQGRIEERTRIFKIAKYRQIFVAQVAGKRAVVHLPVSWRQRRCKSSEVKGEVVDTSLIISPKLGQT